MDANRFGVRRVKLLRAAGSLPLAPRSLGQKKAPRNHRHF